MSVASEELSTTINRGPQATLKSTKASAFAREEAA